MKQGYHIQINRIYESITKCQSIIYTNQVTDKMDKVVDVIMKKPEYIETSEILED